jgi:hypothetical protein
VHTRVILSGFLVFVLAVEATAQNRIRWRPGAILEGLADTVQEVAREIGDREPSAAPVEGSADGAIVDPDHRDYPQHPDHIHHTRPHLPTLSHQTRATWQSSQQATRAVSIDDVIKMVHRGLGESTIVQYIGTNGAKQPLNVSDLIRLHEDGVSEPIINAMQTAKVLDNKAHPNPALRRSKSYPVKGDSRFFEPSHPAVDVEQFGPSILAPPQRPRL